jgi:hypothetical protein
MSAVWLLVRATVRRRWPALAAIAVLVELAGRVPAWLLAGRWAWAVFADSAGVSPAESIPVLLVLLVL